MTRQIPQKLLEMPRSLKGSYILEFELKRPMRVSPGKLGSVTLEAGFYYYIGSARNGLRGRLLRHFSGTGKTFWHIDHITKQIQPVRSFYIVSESRLESEIVTLVGMKLKPAIEGFGCADSKSDVTHLFFSKRCRNFKTHLARLGESGIISVKQ